MRMNAVFLALSVLLLLSGCVESPPVGSQPELTFANFQPVVLNVSRIEIRDNYKPPLQDPNVEHSFPTPPYVAAANLVKRQLVARGGQNILRVVIDDASVVREILPKNKGFWGAFMKEPSERLKARLFLRFELVNPQAPDMLLGHAEVTATRNKLLLEDLPLAARERAYLDMTESLMNDLHQGLLTVVRDKFGDRL